MGEGIDAPYFVMDSRIVGIDTEMEQIHEASKLLRLLLEKNAIRRHRGDEPEALGFRKEPIEEWIQKGFPAGKVDEPAAGSTRLIQILQYVPRVRIHLRLLLPNRAEDAP
jgi:hypothetical protein